MLREEAQLRNKELSICLSERAHNFGLGPRPSELSVDGWCRSRTHSLKPRDGLRISLSSRGPRRRVSPPGSSPLRRPHGRGFLLACASASQPVGHTGLNETQSSASSSVFNDPPVPQPELGSPQDRAKLWTGSRARPRPRSLMAATGSSAVLNMISGPCLAAETRSPSSLRTGGTGCARTASILATSTG